MFGRATFDAEATKAGFEDLAWSNERTATRYVRGDGPIRRSDQAATALALSRVDLTFSISASGVNGLTT